MTASVDREKAGQLGDAAFRRRAIAGLCLLAITGCASAAVSEDRPSQVLPVFVAATNESGRTRRIELQINGVVTIDTTVGQPRSLAGEVLADTIRLVPGSYDLVLLDYESDRVFRARLTTRPEPMFIVIRLLTDRTVFETGYGVLALM